MLGEDRPASRVLGGFEVLDLIGQGGMGSVYLARQISMDRTVALKILSPQLAKDQKYLERFFREARMSAVLNNVHIVQGIDVGEAEGFYYFAMEYVEGPTLAEILQERGDSRSRMRCGCCSRWPPPSSTPTTAGWFTATSNPATSSSAPRTRW